MNDFMANNIITIVASIFAFEVLMGMLSQRLAEKKGHSKRWFWAGFLLSLAGAIMAAGLPDEALRREFMAAAAKPAEKPGNKPAAPPAGRAPVRKPDDGEIAAVLSAAVASMGEQEGRRFVMRSFRPAGEGSTAWNRAGRGRPPPGG